MQTPSSRQADEHFDRESVTYLSCQASAAPLIQVALCQNLLHYISNSPLKFSPRRVHELHYHIRIRSTTGMEN